VDRLMPPPESSGPESPPSRRSWRVLSRRSPRRANRWCAGPTRRPQRPTRARNANRAILISFTARAWPGCWPGWFNDPSTISPAGLLHDVLEDCGLTVEKLSAQFGKTVAELVDGTTKISTLNFSTDQEKQAAICAR